MADVFDRASEREDLERELAIKAQLAASAPQLPRTGRCHNCSEPVAPGAVFCDRDCSADHELRMRARRF